MSIKTDSFKTIILPVVLYSCETWYLTLREEHRLRVLVNRILRRIFGPKRDENGEWRRLQNEELVNIYGFFGHLIQNIRNVESYKEDNVFPTMDGIHAFPTRITINTMRIFLMYHACVSLSKNQVSGFQHLKQERSSESHKYSCRHKYSI